MTSTLHLIFKTHLDLGFTAHASAVRRRYHDYFIPMALDTGEHFLRENPEEPQFVWTTGSWLIHDHLHTQPADRVRRLERGIEDGIIAWHALPFTTHTELMSPRLFAEGIRIARDLNTRFGRRTRTAKMTDVPGHTLGAVEVMAAEGIAFLHLGVNAASPVPDVPPVFRWRAPSGAEVVVMYQNSYGAAMIPEGMTDGIAFAHTMDNAGPQDVSRVIESHDRLGQDHPGMRLRAGTLDDFWTALAPHRDTLPVVTQEIGDTWIHGTGSAPRRMSRFLAAQRSFDVLPDSPERRAFGRTLIEVAEHTWGVDIKTYLRDEMAWDRPDFEAARQTDPRFAYVEAAWAEQDAIVDRALAELPTGAAPDAPATPMVAAPPADDGEAVDGPQTLGPFTLDVDPRSGGLVGLSLGSVSRIAAPEGLFAVTLETYDDADMAGYLDSYLTHRFRWGVQDHGKPGLAKARTARHATFAATGPRCTREGETLWIATQMPEAAQRDFGAPSRVVTGYRAIGDAVLVTVHTIGKQANRQPEAAFARVDLGAPFEMEKMGLAIAPDAVVRNGNRQLHAVTALRAKGMTVTPFDSPLFLVGNQPFLPHVTDCPTAPTGGRFVLWNNKWGTNFSMWCEGDFAFRFRLDFD